MHRRFVTALLALAAFCFAGVAAAQSFPVPSDILAAGSWGSDGWDQVTPTYAAGTTLNVEGTGTPPAYAFEFADIPSSTTGRIITGSWPNTTAGFCTISVSCPEAKLRTHINSTHILKDDPIRNFGQPGQSHCHEFFGNPTVNAHTTYAKIRNEKWTAAAGDVLNSTAYWFPCPIKTVSAVDYAVRADLISIYYEEAPNPNMKHLMRGLRYVLGRNMDDPDDSLAKREIALANAQPGTAGRYSYVGNGISGWICLNGSTPISPTNPAAIASPVLKNADGTDPWAGACTAGLQIYMEFNAPTCWDGVNLWAPGGYKHFRTVINDNVAGKKVCPNGWYRVPGLQGKINFTHQGFSDFGNWRLSSDDMMGTKLASFPVCTSNYSNAPCRESTTSTTVPNGKSFHTDWFGGWDGTIFTTWQQQCLGVDGNTPHQCFDSIISATQKLIVTEAGPVRAPQVDISTRYGTSDTTKMFKVPTTTAGPKTIHTHGAMNDNPAPTANDNTRLAGAEPINFDLRTGRSAGR